MAFVFLTPPKSATIFRHLIYRSLEMKQALSIFLIVVVAGALGHGVLRAVHWQPYSREMFAAGVPALVAGIVALIPALMQRSNCERCHLTSPASVYL